MNLVIKILAEVGLVRKDLDYHVVRAAMVMIYFFFAYKNCFPYGAADIDSVYQERALISWMYRVLGLQGASWFLGASEWVFGALIF